MQFNASNGERHDVSLPMLCSGPEVFHPFADLERQLNIHIQSKASISKMRGTRILKSIARSVDSPQHLHLITASIVAVLIFTRLGSFLLPLR